MHISHLGPLTGVITCSLLLGGCNSSSTEDSTDTLTDSTIAIGALNPANFVTGALASDPVIVDCTLSDGTETTCYQITSAGAPAEQTPGPFCPKTINDNDADSSGMWFDDSGVDGIVELTGNFIKDLAVTYNDANWQLYDATTGKVNVTDTQVSCEGAAKPDVEEAYQNHCVECSMDYLDGGVMSATYLIPTTPIPADIAGSVSQVGIALNGTELSAPAPVSDILSALCLDLPLKVRQKCLLLLLP